MAITTGPAAARRLMMHFVIFSSKNFARGLRVVVKNCDVKATAGACRGDIKIEDQQV
jgi:hypothetical protein